MSRHDASSGDPDRLSGLPQAAFVLKCFAEGESIETIAEKLHGDEQLVRIWISLLLHNHWIESGEAGELRVTIKGQEWVERPSQLCSVAAIKMKRRQIVTGIAGMFLSYELTIRRLVLFPRKVSYSQ